MHFLGLGPLRRCCRCRLTDRAKAAGDPRAGARVWDVVRTPPGAQHSASPKAITARQLQALVRLRRVYDWSLNHWDRIRLKAGPPLPTSIPARKAALARSGSVR